MKITKSQLQDMIKEVLNEDTDKEWKKVQKLLDEIRTNLSELVKYGADYGVFQDAKYASKTLKKAWRDISRIT